MSAIKNIVIVVNCGSSSIKFALYQTGKSLTCMLRGELKAIGTFNTKFVFTDTRSNEKHIGDIVAANHNSAIIFLLGWLETRIDFVSIKAIGHRIVQGMKHTQPELITEELLIELKAISAYDPEHLPDEIKLIETFRTKYPALPQIVCFDTAFHACMPPVAKLLPIPRRYQAMGVQRYGFHGISYTYLVGELERQAGKEPAKGKIILAHLGSGASIAAVNNGTCQDTSMGFTPASGLAMGSRTGDLDPGVVWYFMQTEKLTPQQFNHLINHQSGLLGISETSADMHELLQNETTDYRAAEAVELFCYQAKKWIGSFAAVLNGVDTLVFSGGIGEHACEVRRRICDGLQFLGIELDEASNFKNDAIISSSTSKVCVRVISTNEEWMIAQLVDTFFEEGDKN